MTDKGFGVREIVDEFFVLCREHAGFLAGVAALVAAGYVALDIVAASSSAVSGIVVGVFVQYLVLERLLADYLPAAGSGAVTRRFGVMFVSSIVSGLGILFGVLFFVLPGVLLMAGWSVSAAFIVVERKGPIEALSASWEATRPARWPLTLLVGAAFAIFLALAGGAIFGAAALAEGGLGGQAVAADGSTLAEIVPMNIVASAMGVAGWVLGAAIYRLARPLQAQFDQVFA